MALAASCLACRLDARACGTITSEAPAPAVVEISGKLEPRPSVSDCPQGPGPREARSQAAPHARYQRRLQRRRSEWRLLGQARPAHLKGNWRAICCKLLTLAAAAVFLAAAENSACRSWPRIIARWTPMTCSTGERHVGLDRCRRHRAPQSPRIATLSRDVPHPG